MEDSLDSLAYYRQLFSESRDLTAEARKQADIDDDYYHGYQLTADERRVLQERKQPDNVFNHVRPAVNGTLGVLKQGATDPRAYGRNPQDDDSAEVASKVLRFIADQASFDAMRIDCARDYLINTATALIVGVDEDNQVLLEQIRAEEFFWDPRSRRPDFGDARYMGVAKWMYASQVIRLYPEAKSDIESIVAGGGLSLDSTLLDRPNEATSSWIDRRNKRVLVVEMYHDEGKWMRCVFTAAGILEKSESPYLDRKKRPTNPIVAQSCFVDSDNNRYGIVRDMRGPQDEINKRRSKLLHLLNNRQIQATGPNAEIAMHTSADVARSEAARPDGVLPPGWSPVSLNDMAAGQFNLLGEAKSEIERMGPNPAILARGGENSSGRAQLVRQQAGLTEQAVIFGGIEAWELRVYRAMWERAKQYMTGPDYVRITDDEGSPQYLGINQPQYGPPQIGVHPETGMPMIHRPVMGYENALAEIDVDIMLDTVPDTANLAQEQFLALVDLAKAGVQIPPQLLIESSSLPKKREIIEKMQEMSQQPDPMQQVAQADAMSKIDETKSKTELNLAKVQEIQANVHFDAFKTGHQMGAAVP